MPRQTTADNQGVCLCVDTGSAFIPAVVHHDDHVSMVWNALLKQSMLYHTAGLIETMQRRRSASSISSLSVYANLYTR